VITLSTLLQNLSTEMQYELLARADRLLTAGRYYMGLLSPEQAELLTKDLNTRRTR
jgi:hypothetical protein